MENKKSATDEDMFQIEIILPLFDAKVIKLELPKTTKVFSNVSFQKYSRFLTQGKKQSPHFYNKTVNAPILVYQMQNQLKIQIMLVKQGCFTLEQNQLEMKHKYHVLSKKNNCKFIEQALLKKRDAPIMKIHAMIYIGSIKKKVRIESSVSEGKEEITKCKCMIF